MSNKIILLCLMLSLSGCVLEKPIVPPSPAKVSLVGGDVCFTTPGRDESNKVYSISIEKAGGGATSNNFAQGGNDYISVKENACIPTLGYQFETGVVYHVTIYVSNPDKKIDNDPFKKQAYATSILIWLDAENKKHIKELSRWG
ncbi:putative T6SS immunity periplasmic lipoprotein [Serratia sp. (in: enterobacteria)]|uniref:putative T6SS immunity periplasmic lipoprotein n=1 Tax=Serratia sp. (in: enterobacteria) TaxID=616 RepID=UPI0039894758